MRDRRFDHIGIGIAVGFLFPVICYGIILALIELLDRMDIIEYFNPRTAHLLALCTAIIPFQWFKRRRYDQSMRGMIFPIMLYAAYWLWTYRHLLSF